MKRLQLRTAAERLPVQPRPAAAALRARLIPTFAVILGSWGAESMSAGSQWQLAGNAAELYEDVLVPMVFRPWGATSSSWPIFSVESACLTWPAALESWRDSRHNRSGRRARSQGWISTRVCCGWPAHCRPLQELR